MILLLLLSLSGSPLRGAGLVFLDSASSDIPLVMGADTLHLAGLKTDSGGCRSTDLGFGKISTPLDSARIQGFPGDSLWPTSDPFVRISWSTPGTNGESCPVEVVQGVGGLHFRVRGVADRVVLLDTVFHSIMTTRAGTHEVSRKVVLVQARWQYAPWAPGNRWVRWVDTVDLSPQGRQPLNYNQPLLTLVDSLEIDSIQWRASGQDQVGHLLVVATEPSGRKWSYEHRIGGLPSVHPPGTGTKLPPGTTLRLESMFILGGRAGYVTPPVLLLWEGGRAVDSLVAYPAIRMVEGAARKARGAQELSSSKVFDLLGRKAKVFEDSPGKHEVSRSVRILMEP